MRSVHPGLICGHLTVLDWSSRYKRWRCQCGCGQTIYVATSTLSQKSRCRECWLKSKEHNQFRLSINPQPDRLNLDTRTTSTTSKSAALKPEG